MSLKDFTTFLLPTTKNAELQFYQKPTPAFPKGRILPASFSRPDIGATSGATVFDKDGNLVELAENQPDWSFPLDGSDPKILMRPQLENLILQSAPTSTPSSGLVNATFAASDWGLGFNGKITLDNTSGGALWYPEEASLAVAGNDYTAGVFFKVLDGSPAELGSNAQFYMNIGGTSATPASYKVEEVAPGIYFGQGQVTSSNGGTNTGVLRWTGNPLGQVEVYGFMLFDGLIELKPTDFMPSSGTALTRSANQFTFDDLVTKGVIGNGEGSMLVNPRNFGGTSPQTGVVMIGLNDGALASGKGFGCAANNGPTRYYASLGIGNAFQFFKGNSENEQVVYVWDANGVRAYDIGGLKGSSATTLPSTFKDFTCLTNGNTYEQKPQDIAFAPYAISEAQAITAITEAQNL